MPRRRRIFIVCLILLAIPLVALTLFVVTFDPNAYRDLIEREVTQALGREVRIGGNISLAPSLAPSLALEDVRLANPEWASRSDLALARRLLVQLRLRPLLNGEIEIPRIEVHGLDLVLEQGPGGVDNWSFDDGGSADESVSRARIDRLQLRDASLGYRSDDGGVRRIAVEEAELTAASAGALAVRARGTVNDVSLALKLTSDATPWDLPPDQPWPFEVALELDGTLLQLEGSLPLTDAAAIQLRADLRGGNLAELAPLLGAALPATGPYDIGARIKTTAGAVSIEEIRSNWTDLGGYRLQIADGRISGGNAVPVEISLEGSVDDLSSSIVLSTASLEALLERAGPLPVDLRGELAGSRIEAKGTFAGPREWLPLESRFEFASDDLGPLRPWIGDASTKLDRIAVSGHLIYRPGLLSFEEFDSQLLGSELSGKLAVRLDGERPHLEGSIASPELLLDDLLTRLFPGPASPGTSEANETNLSRLDALSANVGVRVARVAWASRAFADLRARVVIDDGTLAVEQFRVSGARGTDLAASLRLRAEGGHPRFEGRLSSAALNLDDLMPAHDDAGAVDGDGDAWLDAPLELAGLDGIEAELGVEVGQLLGAPIAVEGLGAELRLRHGRLTLDPLRASVAAVGLLGRLDLQRSGEGRRLSGEIQSDAITLGELLESLDLPRYVEGRAREPRLRLDGSGRTVRQILGSLQARLDVGPSVIVVAREQGEVSTEIELRKSTITAQQGRPTRLTLDGSYEGTPFEASITGGTLLELLEADDPWPSLSFDGHVGEGGPVGVVGRVGTLSALLTGQEVGVGLELRFAGAQAKVRGVLPALDRWQKTDFLAEASGPDLSAVARRAGFDGLPEVPFSVATRIRGSPSRIELREMRVRFAETEVSGSVSFVPGDRPGIEAELSADWLDLRPFLPQDAEPATAAADADRPEMVFSDDPLPLDLLHRADVDLELRAARLTADVLDIANADLLFHLENGHLGFEATLDEGHGSGRLTVAPDENGVRAELGLRTEQLRRGKLFGADAETLERQAPVDLDLSLSGSGKSIHELMSRANGFVRLRLGQGRYPRLPTVFGSDLAYQLLTAVKMRERDPHTTVTCAATYFDVRDGLATATHGFALQTLEVNLVGSGWIRLDTEEVDAVFRTAQRKGVGVSGVGIANQFLKLGGTLSRTKVEASPKRIATTTAMAWATAGLSLLADGVVRRILASDDPCAKILERVDEAELRAR